MYYIIYKITNKIDNKIYIGAHKTANLDDGYMGSGRYINNAISKYGVENFTKEILHQFNSTEEMYAKEAELVTEDFVNDKNTYNLNLGGVSGSWYHINKSGRNIYPGHADRNREKQPMATQAFIAKSKTDPEWNYIRKCKISIALNHYYEKNPGSFSGKKHTEESKRKMSESSKGTGIHKANSQYGTMWITNGIENKKQPKDQPIPDGWRKGRNYD